MKGINDFNDNALANISFIKGGTENSNVKNYDELSEAEKATVVFEEREECGKPFGRTHYTDECGNPRTDIIIFWITIKINPHCPNK